MYLVIVDAYSKFIEVAPMAQATRTNTVAARVFSYFGLPKHLVTDNGIQFASADFQKFLKDNDIEHRLTAPGHPATNGLAERYVGEFKDKLNKIGDTGETVQTVHTGWEKLMNRQRRIRLSALRFKTTKQEVKVFQNNLDNKPNHIRLCSCAILEKVQNGYQVELQKQSVQEMFNVQVGDTLWKRHEEQLQPRHIPTDQCTD